MKKILLALALASVSVATFAQSDDVPTKKYSVATNSFWSNWFIQGGVQWTAFYSSAEHGFDLSNSPFKSFRSNPQVAVAIGKWFTPGLGLRTKVSGIWGKAQGGTNWSGKEYSSFKYWNAQEQVLFNVSNMLCGYNPNRVYNFIPFAGAGFARNMSLNTYAMGLSVGILNEFNISKKVAINLELGWNRLENDFYSTDGTTNNGERGWDSHDNYLYAEVGLTYNLGKTGWDAVPDVDALNAQHQAALDALNAKLADAEKDNANLRKQLANQPKPQPAVDKTITELITTPVSVFFNCDKIDIASQKDLVNVRAIAKYAKDNNRKVKVTGYADSATGSVKRNQWLSDHRAEVVANEIVKMGVPQENIETEGKGGVDHLSPTNFNRRATVQIVE